MKKLLQLKLKIWAKLILNKYKPQVIGITGSVGKTTTKEAIYTVLKDKMRVRQSDKNYNNELGLPLTVLGEKAYGKNIFGWIKVGFTFLGLWLFRDKDYPEVLILEMGIDAPGDMDYLNSIVDLHIGVATAIGTVHVEYFKDRKALVEEKGKLIAHVQKNGTAVLNVDEPEVLAMRKRTDARTLTYGIENEADVNVTNVEFSYKGDDASQLKGVKITIKYKDMQLDLLNPSTLGKGMIYSTLAAVAVGLAMDLNIKEIVHSLEHFRSPKGRLNIIDGIKYTTIIDDTYNSEPKSLELAIDTLQAVKLGQEQRKLVAVGDMLELGVESEAKHMEIGRKIAEFHMDMLFTVGERARDIARGARDAGMTDDRIHSFNTSVEAGKFIQNKLKKGDYLLVKGSQGARMEKVVLELMAEPLRAEELLVRMDKTWRDR